MKKYIVGDLVKVIDERMCFYGIKLGNIGIVIEQVVKFDSIGYFCKVLVDNEIFFIDILSFNRIKKL